MFDREHYAQGFAAVANRNCRVLILGSLPGQRSLAAAEYYAQPRNAFWSIMGELFAAGPDIDYAERLRALLAHRVALWDVVAAGVRPGSLDSSIERSTVVVNDFARFFGAHSKISRILFNGKTAESLYRRLVIPELKETAAAIETVTLPSTSPAHAAMPYQQKLNVWRDALAMDRRRSPARG